MPPECDIFVFEKIEIQFYCSKLLSMYVQRRRRRILLQPSVRTTSEIMNWIILIVAGLCECGFTFCLGKAKVATGWEARPGTRASSSFQPSACFFSPRRASRSQSGRESLNKCVSLHSKPHFEMKHECKITVLETKCFADYQEKYLAGEAGLP